METEQQRIERLVREVQSGQRTMASVRQSVDRLAGRAPGDYSGVSDAAWLGDPGRLAERIRSIFTNRGVALAPAAAPTQTAAPAPRTTTETEAQRLDRITQEVLSGRRTLNSVRESIDRLSGRAPGDYGQVSDAAWQSTDQLRERIRAIFVNRNVPIGSELPPPPAQPAAGSPGTPGAPAVPGRNAQPAPDNSAAERAERERGLQAERDMAAREKADRERKARVDSYARLNSVLEDYGLGGLGSSVQKWLVEGLSEAEITQRMRDTTEFKTRFAGIEARKKAGLPAISPGEYVAYERNAAQLMRAAGLPAGFYDSPDDFTAFLTKDVSIAELGDRVTLAANAAFKMPKEDRDALAAWGMGPGDLTAFWLDPDRAQPMLEKRYAAAQLAGSAKRASWGDLDVDNAERLAGLGVTAPQAEEGFGKLVESKELFTSLDRGEDEIGQTEQLGAAFEGNANARRRIEQRARRRTSTFQGGGGYASSQEGLVGLGDAQ